MLVEKRYRFFRSSIGYLRYLNFTRYSNNFQFVVFVTNKKETRKKKKKIKKKHLLRSVRSALGGVIKRVGFCVGQTNYYVFPRNAYRTRFPRNPPCTVSTKRPEREKSNYVFNVSPAIVVQRF